MPGKLVLRDGVSRCSLWLRHRALRLLRRRWWRRWQRGIRHLGPSLRCNLFPLAIERRWQPSPQGQGWARRLWASAKVLPLWSRRLPDVSMSQGCCCFLQCRCDPGSLGRRMPRDAGGAFLSADGGPLCPAVPDALDASGTDGSEAVARPAIKARRSFSSSACHSGSLSSNCTLSSSVDSGWGSGSSSKKCRGTLVRCPPTSLDPQGGTARPSGCRPGRRGAFPDLISVASLSAIFCHQPSPSMRIVG